VKNKIDKMLRNRSIKDKLNLVFRMVTISYLLLVVVSLIEMVMSKNIPGIIIILVLAVLGVAFNAYVMKRLAALLVAPIESLVVAAEKISQGDFEIGTPYEAEDELGELSNTFETAAGVLKKVISDLLTIVESFSEGNFNVRSSCPEAYVGQLRSVLDELVEMVVKISETMHGIQESGEQVSAGSGQLAESAQDIAEGATNQAAAVEELVATVDEVTNQVLENTKSTDIVHDKAKQVGIEASKSQKKMDELVDAVLVGGETFVPMLLFGIPYAPLISVVVAVTNIVPMLGPYLGAVPGAALLLFSGQPVHALEFLVIVLVVQQVDGNFIAPRILGSATGISGLWVLAAIVVGGGLFGIPGMVIGVPVLGVAANLAKAALPADPDGETPKPGGEA